MLGLYGLILLGYLFWHPEPELWHWLTLVALPLALVARAGRYPSPSALLQSVGFAPNLPSRGRGLTLAFLIGFQGVQLLNRAQRADLLALAQTRWGPLLPMLAFVLLLGTAATTEEIFFRGLLQARFTTALRSPLGGAVLTTLAFALYHVPYAYAHADPASRRLVSAVGEGVANGLVGGIPLALVYWRTGYRLLPAIAVHAAIDLLPATRWLGARLATV